jgi:hypothetical protein
MRTDDFWCSLGTTDDVNRIWATTERLMRKSVGLLAVSREMIRETEEILAATQRMLEARSTLPADSREYRAWGG